MSNIIIVGGIGTGKTSLIARLTECGLNAIEATASLNHFNAAMGDYKLESKQVSKKKWTDRKERWR